MKKKKHLETEFLRFLLEKQKQLKNEDELEEPIEGEPIEDDEVSEMEDDEPIEEDDERIIEKLTLKYKKLKREYENQLFHRKRG